MDIYSEWAGPCTAMSGALKKIKLEVGDDSLVYAMARSDSIPALEMFQGHCKPTYLFIASGHMLHRHWFYSDFKKVKYHIKSFFYK